MSFGCPARMSIPERIIGLAPSVLLSCSSDDLVSGLPDELFRLGARVSFTDRRPSSPFEEGLSSLLLTTFVSYGLNASLLGSDGGLVRLELRVVRFVADDGLEPARADASLPGADFFLSKDDKSALGVGESAPIWLQVWASRARGLFLASNYK